MRRVLPRALLTCDLLRVLINNNGSACVRASIHLITCKAMPPFLCNAGRRLLHFRHRVTCLIRGRHATVYLIRVSLHDNIYAHGYALSVPRGYEQNGLSKRQTTVRQRRELTKALTLFVRTVNCVLLTHAILTRCRGTRFYQNSRLCALRSNSRDQAIANRRKRIPLSTILFFLGITRR